MRRDVMKFGAVIQRHAVGSENMIDAGIIQQAGLISGLLQARLDLGFNACIEHDLVRDAGRIMSGLIAQREAAIGVHARLSELSLKLGIDPRAFGDGGEKDGLVIAPQEGEAAAHLAVVR